MEVLSLGRGCQFWEWVRKEIMGDERRSLCEILPQSEVKVANLKLLGEHKGGVGVVAAILFGGARDPFVDRCALGVVAPPS